MYLKLTTPFNPGNNDTGNTYPSMFITQVTDNRASNNLQYIVEAGNFVSVKSADGLTTTTVWQKGAGAIPQINTVTGAAYTTLQAAASLLATETPFNAIHRLLYNGLLATYPGTITTP